MMTIEAAPTYEHGFVTGRYLTAVADGPDPDRLMDFTPAKGKVVFTPESVIRRHDGPAPALVVQRPVKCNLDDQGYLTSPGGGRGVALISGIYAVHFEVEGAQVPGPQRIEVKATHTEGAPLDLVLAMPEVVPPGSVVVVDESTAQRAEAAAKRAEGVLANIEDEVRAVVLASPELRGVEGRTPVLSWEGTTLVVDGVPGPDLRGLAGGPGPAPSIKIGTVTSGTTPAATIKGTSPDLTLDLVLAKGGQGDKGDPGSPGAPGAVANASSYILVGQGRPDVPSTTGGVIGSPDTAPVGAEYRSIDGANVGADRWIKRSSGWRVSVMDSGWRELAVVRKSDASTDATMTARVRITASVTYLEMTVVVTAASSGWQLLAVNDAWLQEHYLKPGASGPVGRKDAFHLTPTLTWGIRPESYPQKVYITGGGNNGLNGLPTGTWVLTGSFLTPAAIPTTLGNPA